MKKYIAPTILLLFFLNNTYASTFTMDSAIFSTKERYVVSVEVMVVDNKNNAYKYVIPNNTSSFTVNAPRNPYSVVYREVYMTPEGKKTWATSCIDKTGGYNNEGYLFEPTWDYNVHFTQPEGDVNVNPECYTYHSVAN